MHPKQPGHPELYAEVLRLREQLERSEEKNRELQFALQQHELGGTAMNHIRASVFLTDIQGRIVFGNPHCLEMFGYHPEEFMGRHYSEFSSAEDLSATAERMEKILRGKLKQYSVERRWKKKDGSVFWTETNISGIPDEKGKICYLAAVMIDVSNWKRFEAALMENERHLLESEHYLATVLEMLRAGVMIIDYDTHRINDVNNYAAELIGTEKEKILGRKCYDFFSLAREGKCPVTDMGEKPEQSEQFLITAGRLRIPILKSVTTSVRKGRKKLVECFTDISFLRQLLREQEMDIGLAKKILIAVNGNMPRYTHLSDRLRLFAAVISLACNQEGGDHYFIRTLPADRRFRGGRTVISLKDQSGHQVSCVLRSIFTDLFYQSVFNRFACMSLEEIIRHVNKSLYRSSFFQADDFFTAIHCEIDHESLMMRYVSCGHPKFSVIRKGEVLFLPDRRNRGGANPPMLIFEDYPFRAGTFQLEAEDRLLLYTDGLLEATVPEEKDQKGNESLSFRKMGDMITRMISVRYHMPVEEIMHELLAEIARISDTEIEPGGKNMTRDDITLLGLEIEHCGQMEEERWYPQNAEHLQEISEKFLREHTGQWEERGFTKPFRLRACMEEALLNAWLHGHKCNPEKAILVRYRYANDFHIEILDRGEGFDIRQVPDPRKKENLAKESGRGLFMIRHYASDARWDKKGRHLRMSFQKVPRITEDKNFSVPETYPELSRFPFPDQARLREKIVSNSISASR